MKKASYKKLFKLLIDLEISKSKLSDMAGISSSTVTKLSKGECVNMDMLVRICNTLDCDLHEIVELVSDEENDVIELRKKKINKMGKD